MMDQQDRELFELGLRGATERHTGAALDTALDELGWADALAVDPQAAVSLLFELQGGAHATSSALDRVILTRLGLADDPAPGLVLPALGGGDPPGQADGEHLCVRGLGSAALRHHETAVVVGSDRDQLTVAVVDTADLALRSVAGLDPTSGLVEVTGDRLRATTRSAPPPTAWADAVAAGQLAVAHELVGVSRAMLQLARGHALERVQFDRPIANFQAVRHRLADALVAIETADAMASAAWEDPSPLTASVAKAMAGRGARTAARHGQQVLAGIGFTTEHPFHRYLRRGLVLDQVLGSARSLTRELGTDLLRDRRIPAILPL